MISRICSEPFATVSDPKKSINSSFSPRRVALHGPVPPRSSVVVSWLLEIVVGMFSIYFILAFGFGSPLMLWGLAAGAIPIVIHLLHRRRFQTVPWAAMRFLLAATKKQSRRIKLEQLLLLLIRTLIILLVALALSRPIA